MVAQHPREIGRLAAEHFGISGQAANKHLRSMVAAGILDASGNTRARRYTLPTNAVTQHFEISGLDEYDVWNEHVKPALLNVPENVRGICVHGVTEMINNAVDHSEGRIVLLTVKRIAGRIEITVADDGTGIFRKIKSECGLASEQEAVLELAKGKLTTDPSRHSGEGIFFTSRMFDVFEILSGSLYLSHTVVPERDWLLERRESVGGTCVNMVISETSERTTVEVFNRFSSTDGEYEFAITHVPVGLATIGDDNLVSRSQGKRLVARFERFREVILDFAGVSMIGQAFADQVFRVFVLDHPEVQLMWFNANPEVTRMIRRAVAELRKMGAQVHLPAPCGPDVLG